jgi:hypothetical protein
VKFRCFEKIWEFLGFFCNIFLTIKMIIYWFVWFTSNNTKYESIWKIRKGWFSVRILGSNPQIKYKFGFFFFFLIINWNLYRLKIFFPNFHILQLFILNFGFVFYFFTDCSNKKKFFFQFLMISIDYNLY